MNFKEIESINYFLEEYQYDVLIKNFNELDEILKSELENKFQIGFGTKNLCNIS